MKMIKIILLFINFFLTIQKSQINISLNKTSKIHKYRCSVDQIKYNPPENKKSEEEVQKKPIKLRKLQSSNYQSIRIYLSTSSLNSQITIFSGGNTETITLYSEIINYLNNVVVYISKLINVVPRNAYISYSTSKQRELGIVGATSYDSILNNGIPYDLVVIPAYTIDNKIFITSKVLEYDNNNHRPIVSLLVFNFDLIQTQDTNKKFYIESLLLHEFTHILGFLVDTFQYFPGGRSNVIKTE